MTNTRSIDMLVISNVLTMRTEICHYDFSFTKPERVVLSTWKPQGWRINPKEAAGRFYSFFTGLMLGSNQSWVILTTPGKEQTRILRVAIYENTRVQSRLESWTIVGRVGPMVSDSEKMLAMFFAEIIRTNKILKRKTVLI